MTDNYYSSNLYAANLRAVYETKIPRIERYLNAEIEFVKGELSGVARVIEIGAGYGRILKALSGSASSLVGVEISPDTVAYGAEYLKDVPNCSLRCADIHTMPIESGYDVVLGLQNALSAVKGDAAAVVKKCVAMLGENGRAYFSSYASAFWEHRLEWFDEQAAKGLLGEVDREKSGYGVLVCKDGFKATTFSREDFESLGETSGCDYRVTEVDGSSIFLILYKGGKSV